MRIFYPDALSQVSWQGPWIPKTSSDVLAVMVNYHAVATIWTTFMLPAAIIGFVISVIMGSGALLSSVVGIYITIPLTLVSLSYLLVRKLTDWDDISNISYNWFFS